MNIVIGLDWSDDAMAALRIVTDQFLADRITLVHAVDLGPFKSPLFASTVVSQAFEGYKVAVELAGKELLDATTAKIPSGKGQIERILQEGKPSNVILDAARKQDATLLAVGTRGRNRTVESILGSASHHIVMKAPCPVLIARAPAATIERLIVGVEAFDDAHVLTDWLRVTPFRKRPPVHVVSAVPAIQLFDPVLAPALRSWPEDSLATARGFVDDIVQRVTDLGFAATGVALEGDPARCLINEAGSEAMIVMASHARRGVERLLLGSVSHAVVHHARCPLVVVPMAATY
jgi:nucleotide-binding universal stress UspA family protein